MAKQVKLKERGTEETIYPVTTVSSILDGTNRFVPETTLGNKILRTNDNGVPYWSDYTSNESSYKLPTASVDLLGGIKLQSTATNAIVTNNSNTVTPLKSKIEINDNSTVYVTNEIYLEENTPAENSKAIATSGLVYKVVESLSILENGKIPSSYLPSYVDDVLEYTTIASFPNEGESGKIYVDITTNLAYRWSGTQYTEISKSIGLGKTELTAYPGNLGALLETKVSSCEEFINSYDSSKTLLVLLPANMFTNMAGGEYSTSIVSLPSDENILKGNYDVVVKINDDYIIKTRPILIESPKSGSRVATTNIYEFDVRTNDTTSETVRVTVPISVLGKVGYVKAIRGSFSLLKLILELNNITDTMVTDISNNSGDISTLLSNIVIGLIPTTGTDLIIKTPSTLSVENIKQGKIDLYIGFTSTYDNLVKATLISTKVIDSTSMLYTYRLNLNGIIYDIDLLLTSLTGSSPTCVGTITKIGTYNNYPTESAVIDMSSVDLFGELPTTNTNITTLLYYGKPQYIANCLILKFADDVEVVPTLTRSSVAPSSYTYQYTVEIGGSESIVMTIILSKDRSTINMITYKKAS